MKKKLLALIMSLATVATTASFAGCKDTVITDTFDVMIENQDLKDDKKALNKFIDEMTTKVAEGTAVIYDKITFETDATLELEQTKVYFFNDCKFEGNFTVSDKTVELNFIDCEFNLTQKELKEILDFSVVEFLECVCEKVNKEENSNSSSTEEPENPETPETPEQPEEPEEPEEPEIVESEPLTEFTEDTTLENISITVMGVGDAIAVGGDITVTIDSGYFNGGQTPFGGAGNTAVWVHDGGKVVINDGRFYIGGLATDDDGNKDTGHIDLIYCSGGSIEINGGWFEGANADVWLLNCKDASYNNGNATITVKGGTFVNWNPADCVSEGEHTSFVAEGFTVEATQKQNGDIWYVVVPVIAE